MIIFMEEHESNNLELKFFIGKTYCFDYLTLD